MKLLTRREKWQIIWDIFWTLWMVLSSVIYFAAGDMETGWTIFNAVFTGVWIWFLINDITKAVERIQAEKTKRREIE